MEFNVAFSPLVRFWHWSRCIKAHHYDFITLLLNLIRLCHIAHFVKRQSRWILNLICKVAKLTDPHAAINFAVRVEYCSTLTEKWFALRLATQLVVLSNKNNSEHICVDTCPVLLCSLFWLFIFLLWTRNLAVKFTVKIVGVEFLIWEVLIICTLGLLFLFAFLFRDFRFNSLRLWLRYNLLGLLNFLNFFWRFSDNGSFRLNVVKNVYLTTLLLLLFGLGSGWITFIFVSSSGIFSST